MRIRNLLILAALIPTAVAIHAEESGYLTFTVSPSAPGQPNPVTITGVTSAFSGTILEIPAEIEWHNTMLPVTTIGENAFAHMSELEEVTLPASITSIEGGAFYDCTALKSINLPDGLTSLKSKKDTYHVYGVFGNCSSLQSIILPSTLTYIGEECFARCSSLIAIAIPESVHELGGGMFNSCYNLREVTIPDHIVTLSSSKVRGYIYPSNKETDIYQGFFARCRSLTSVALPSALTTLGEQCFRGCTALERISLPEGLSAISEYAFQTCSSLTALDIPQGVNRIGDEAFAQCTALKEISLKGSPERIGTALFNECDALEKVVCLWPEVNTDLANRLKKEALLVCLPDTYVQYHGLHFNTSIFGLGRPQQTCYADGFAISFEDSEIDGGYSTDILLDGVSTPFNKSTDNGITQCAGLIPNTDYTVQINYNYANTPYQLVIPFRTLLLLPGYRTSSTQATLSVEMVGPAKMLEPEKAAFACYMSASDLHPLNNNKCTFKGLCADQSYKIYIRGILNGKNYDCDIKERTKPVIGSIEAVAVTPVSVTAHASIIPGDAPLDRIEYHLDSQHVTGGEYATFFFDYTGDQYNRYLWVNFLDAEGNILQQSPGKWYRNPDLIWEDYSFTATSKTSARLTVSTNLPDAFANTGIEWRRSDAPEQVPSFSAPCAIYGGHLTGSLHNLSSDAYYLFRPWYGNSNGERFYGEWSGLYTADAGVFFTPEIITFEPELTSSSITFSGYVLAGTDPILRQGFQFRPTGTHSSAPLFAQAEWREIEADGILMKAVAPALEKNMDYVCRTFAVTSTDTYFGEEQYFHTDETGFNGVDSISVSGTDTARIETGIISGQTMLRVVGSDIKILTLSIYSTDGILLRRCNVSADGQWQHLPSTLKSGIYLLTAEGATPARLLIP